MLRRSHKKSRRGCLECKRRHVKCDEQRPRCGLCIVSERDCSLAGDARLRQISKSNTCSRLPSPYRDQQKLTVTTANASPLSSTSTISSDRQTTCNHCDSISEDTINFSHMELIVHCQLNPGIFNLGVDINDLPSSRLALGLETALKAPYLMYQLLAFSARHLAYLHPESSASYLRQARTLQTRAISLFTAVPINVDKSNCVPILLFSCALGYHLLADALNHQVPDGPDPLVTRFTQFLSTHRGVFNIANSAWPLLIESKLGPILKLSEDFTSRLPRGNDCRRILEMVDAALDLSVEERSSCESAIQYLQVGMDAATATDLNDVPINRHQMILEWPMLVPPEYTDLLAAKRPLSLVILAHYAVLLHYGKHLWQIGNAGAHIFGVIDRHLGSGYDYWLEIPRGKINSSVE